MTILPPTPEWMERAKCRRELTILEADRLFFPDADGRSATAPARAFCNGTESRRDTPCPVRAECLELALTTNTRDGVWGGMSPRMRKPLHEQRSKALRERRVAVGD